MYVSICYDEKPEETPEEVEFELRGDEETPGYNIEINDEDVIGVFKLTGGQIRINYDDDGELGCEKIECGQIADAYTQRMVDIVT
jgi:hypothetical protein